LAKEGGTIGVENVRRKEKKKRGSAREKQEFGCSGGTGMLW